MIRRIGFITVPIIVLILLVTFLITSETGLRFIEDTLSKFSGGSFRVEQINGTLVRGVQASGISYVSKSNTLTVESLSVTWQPQKLLSGTLHLDDLKIVGAKIHRKAKNQKENDEAAATEQFLWIPFMKIEASNLELSDIAISNESKATSHHIKSVRVSGTYTASKILLRSFSYHEKGVMLSGAGEVRLQGKESEGNLSGELALKGYGFHWIEGAYNIEGSLNELGVNFLLDIPGDILIHGKIFDVLSESHTGFNYDLQLSAKRVDLAELIRNCPSIDLHKIDASISGDRTSYRGDVEAIGLYDTFDALHLKSRLAGNLQSIAFESLRIDRGDSFVVAEGGEVSWRDIFSWQGNFTAENFDLSRINRALDLHLSGEFVSRGDVQTNGVKAVFENINIDINRQDQQANIVGDIYVTESGLQTENGLTIQTDSVNGIAHINNLNLVWDDGLATTASIELQRFNPVIFHSAFYGKVDGSFVIDAQKKGAGFSGLLQIDGVGGELRGNPLSGYGELAFRNGLFESKGLFLKNGSTELTVSGYGQGSPGENGKEDLSLDFEFISPDLNNLHPLLYGQVEVGGNLSGSRSRDSLQLKGTISVKELLYANYSLDHATAEIDIPIWGDGATVGSAHLEELSNGSKSIASCDLQLSGTSLEHILGVTIRSSLGEIELQANGSYCAYSRNDICTTTWDGNIQDTKVRSKDFGVWEQKGSSHFIVTKDLFSLEDFCFGENSSSICLHANYTNMNQSNTKVWKIDGNVENFAIDNFSSDEVIKRGMLNGNFSVVGSRDSIQKGSVELDLSEGGFELRRQDEESIVLRLNESGLAISLVETVMAGSLIVDTEKNGRLELVVSSDDFTLAGKTDHVPSIKGEGEIEGLDLSFLSFLTEYYIEPNGTIDSDFFLAGTLRKPKIYGEATVKDGGVHFPYQGVILEDIQLSLSTQRDGTGFFATANSSSGIIQGNGIVRYIDDGIQGNIRVTGEDFLLVNLPEYVIRVDPDVNLLYQKGVFDIKGWIHVPKAIITPEEQKDVVKASKDVVFIDEKDVQSDTSNLLIDLSVTLGEEVIFDGYGIDGKLLGTMQIFGQPNDSLQAKGQLSLDKGKYTFYSRSLDIARGRVLFSGGPLISPNLDILAQRTVSDKEARERGYTIGVAVGGPIGDLQFSLYSNPYMDDTEILSYLVFGHSLAGSSDEEMSTLGTVANMLGLQEGVDFLSSFGPLFEIDDLHLEGSSKDEDVSLVVGKKLTEDLYIGYDVNMFSQLGQFKVRYDLGKGFWVETKSSSESTGADLLYSFER